MRMLIFLLTVLGLAMPLAAQAQNYQMTRPPSQFDRQDLFQRSDDGQRASTPERSEPSGATVRPQDFAGRPPMATIDENQLLKNRVMSLRKSVVALQSRVASLEEQLRRMASRSTFECRDVGTSANGAGDTEDCAPYACNYIDGRCRTVCATSDHCAPGFLCDTGAGRCVPPPPPARDDDDSWWPF